MKQQCKKKIGRERERNGERNREREQKWKIKKQNYWRGKWERLVSKVKIETVYMWQCESKRKKWKTMCV